MFSGDRVCETDFISNGSGGTASHIKHSTGRLLFSHQHQTAPHLRRHLCWWAPPTTKMTGCWTAVEVPRALTGTLIPHVRRPCQRDWGLDATCCATCEMQPELKYTTMTGTARIECFVAENGDIFGTKVLCAFCAMRRDRAKSLNPRRVQQQLQQQQQLKGRIIAWEIRLVDAHVIQLLQ